MESEYKKIIEETNPKLYRLFGRFVENTPYSNDGWFSLYQELVDISKNNDEIRLFELLLNDSSELLNVSQNKNFILRFLLSYPNIIWLLEKIESGIWKIYVSSDQIKEIHAILPNNIESLLPFIKSREVARFLSVKHPNILFTEDLQDVIKRGNFGEALWRLEVEDLSHYRNLATIIIDTGNEELILSYWEKKGKKHANSFSRILIDRGESKVFSSIAHHHKFTLEELAHIILPSLNQPHVFSLILSFFPDDYDLTDIIINGIENKYLSEEVMRIIPKNRINYDEVFSFVLDMNNKRWINYFALRIDFTQLSEKAILSIISNGRTEMLKELISLPTFKPPIDSIRKAIVSPDIMAILLADGRADPTIDIKRTLDNLLDLIASAYVYRNYDEVAHYKKSLQLLLLDERVKETVNPLALLLSNTYIPDVFRMIFDLIKISEDEMEELGIELVKRASYDVTPEVLLAEMIKIILPFIKRPENILNMALKEDKKYIIDAILDYFPHLRR